MWRLPRSDRHAFEAEHDVPHHRRNCIDRARDHADDRADAEQQQDRNQVGEGRHRLHEIAAGVAFGVNGALSSLDGEPADVAVKLELDQWNGAVSPRAVLRDLYPLPQDGEHSEQDGAGCPRLALGGEWWDRLRAELELGLDEWPPPRLLEASGDLPRRRRVERPEGSGIATIADLVSSGQPVLALCADVSRRRGLAERAADPARFGGGPTCMACGRCADQARRRFDEFIAAGRGLALADWAAVTRDPELALRFEHVVLVDPPPFAHLEALAAGAHRSGSFLHLTWGAAEVAFARRVHERDWDLRPALAELYRALGEAEDHVGERLAEILAGPGAHPRTPEQAGRCARVLEDLGLVEWAGSDRDPALRVVSSEATELEQSSAFVAYQRRFQEGRQFLSRQRQAHQSSSAPPR